MATLHAAARVRVGCGSEPGAFAHEFRKVAVDDAVALLDGIVAREDVLGVVVAKWQVKGGKIRKVIKKYPLNPRICTSSAIGDFEVTCQCTKVQSVLAY